MVVVWGQKHPYVTVMSSNFYYLHFAEDKKMTLPAKHGLKLNGNLSCLTGPPNQLASLRLDLNNVQ